MGGGLRGRGEAGEIRRMSRRSREELAMVFR